MIVSQIFKKEICKDMLNKSGQSSNKNTVNGICSAVMGDRFLYELENNDLVAFVTWELPQSIDGKNKVFVENLWIDPRHRNGKYLLRIRTLLRNMFRDTSGIWFNRKKQVLIERS